MPLFKIAIGTGQGVYGLICWQLVVGSALMATACVIRRTRLPLNGAALGAFTVSALIGTVFLNPLVFTAAAQLPWGIMALLLSVIPLFGFASALAVGNDTFAWWRRAGFVFGLAGF